ncbi:hypothetical protein ACBR40_33760 [Nonomuraea sp. AD125B]|jgi:hypothetical protein|uniref:hypothetical protein n=1 Tax=Nonomuraea TaxID=83681 RepID=UPI0031DEE265
MRDLGLGVLVGILIGTVVASLALALSDLPSARAAGTTRSAGSVGFTAAISAPEAGQLNLIYQLNLAFGRIGRSA